MSEYPPLWIMARRLAPYVARGDISFTEAHHTIMAHVVRCRWDEIGQRLDLADEFVTLLLSRETERARSGASLRATADG